ncbi:MAG: CpaF family protein [Thermoguttaceae bacterium]|nr:CpaF family protein [Thermoguttaceae bacterium]
MTPNQYEEDKRDELARDVPDMTEQNPDPSGKADSKENQTEESERRKIYERSTRFFLTPVLPLLDDEDVSDILINGPNTIYYEKKGKLHLYEGGKFASDRALQAAANNIAEFTGRQVGGARHSVDARLPDGSRVHIIVPPASGKQGVCISIRRFKQNTFNLDIMVNTYGTMTAEVAEFLQLIVKMHKNTVVSGGTGSGKTSLLNAMSTAIPDEERIIVIEDSAELQLNQPHTVYLEAQPYVSKSQPGVTIRELFVDTLRMRPDRIVVGEVRRGEALDLLQSMLSGHEGSLTTVHANTPYDAAIRLETLSLMSDVELPVYVARTQVASAVQVVVQTARLSDGSRRLQHVAECLGLDEKEHYVFKDIYKFRRRGVDAEGRIIGGIERTGYVPTFAKEPFERGLGDEVKLTRGVFDPEATPSAVREASSF